MRRFEPVRRAQLVLCLSGAVWIGLALPGIGRAMSPVGAGAGQRTPSPGALAGRYERVHTPGGYVDVHGPFTAVEARLVAGYRDAEGRPIAAAR